MNITRTSMPDCLTPSGPGFYPHCGEKISTSLQKLKTGSTVFSKNFRIFLEAKRNQRRKNPVTHSVLEEIQAPAGLSRNQVLKISKILKAKDIPVALVSKKLSKPKTIFSTLSQT